MNRTKAEKIDAVLAHRIWGFPVFLGIVFLIFYFTFVLGKYPVAWIELFFHFLKHLGLTYLGGGPFRDMLVNGILAGIGGVAVYLPNILLLFLFIALMDSSGYTASTAMITDKWMRKAGLPGRSFIPLLMGFGCNVTAIMAAGTIENRRERILTVLIIPFMSCSARLPVYILFISTFFPDFRAAILFCIYLTGILAGWLTALLFSRTLLKNEEQPMNLILPPYRIPGIRSLLKQMWNRTWYFIKKMSGVILVASLIIWALGYFPCGSPKELFYRINDHSADISGQVALNGTSTENITPDCDSLVSGNQDIAAQVHRLENSCISRIGRWIHPVFVPLGFDWKMSISILTGFPAKEIVISTMAVLYNSQSSDTDPAEINKSDLEHTGLPYPALTAISFMIFILLSFPCMGTLTAIHRESGSRWWMLFSFLYTTGIAWLLSFMIYQIGTALS